MPETRRRVFSEIQTNRRTRRFPIEIVLGVSAPIKADTRSTIP
jgi:hypothetical protein